MTAPDWDFYKCKVNDKLSSIYVDLAVANDAPISSLPILHWHWIRLLFPDDRGLSTDEEFDALCEYEDALAAALSGDENIKYVGRITGSGRREFYFYSSEHADFHGRIDSVVSDHPEYQFQGGSKEDTEWRQYLDLLYPGKNGLEQIRNRRSER